MRGARGTTPIHFRVRHLMAALTLAFFFLSASAEAQSRTDLDLEDICPIHAGSGDGSLKLKEECKGAIQELRRAGTKLCRDAIQNLSNSTDAVRKLELIQRDVLAKNNSAPLPKNMQQSDYLEAAQKADKQGDVAHSNQQQLVRKLYTQHQALVKRKDEIYRAWAQPDVTNACEQSIRLFQREMSDQGELAKTVLAQTNKELTASHVKYSRNIGSSAQAQKLLEADKDKLDNLGAEEIITDETTGEQFTRRQQEIKSSEQAKRYLEDPNADLSPDQKRELEKIVAKGDQLRTEERIEKAKADTDAFEKKLGEAKGTLESTREAGNAQIDKAKADIQESLRLSEKGSMPLSDANPDDVHQWLGTQNDKLQKLDQVKKDFNADIDANLEKIGKTETQIAEARANVGEAAKGELLAKEIREKAAKGIYTDALADVAKTIRADDPAKIQLDAAINAAAPGDKAEAALKAIATIEADKARAEIRQWGSLSEDEKYEKLSGFYKEYEEKLAKVKRSGYDLSGDGSQGAAEARKAFQEAGIQDFKDRCLRDVVCRQTALTGDPFKLQEAEISPSLTRDRTMLGRDGRAFGTLEGYEAPKLPSRTEAQKLFETTTTQLAEKPAIFEKMGQVHHVELDDATIAAGGSGPSRAEAVDQQFKETCRVLVRGCALAATNESTREQVTKALSGIQSDIELREKIETAAQVATLVPAAGGLGAKAVKQFATSAVVKAGAEVTASTLFGTSTVASLVTAPRGISYLQDMAEARLAIESGNANTQIAAQHGAARENLIGVGIDVVTGALPKIGVLGDIKDVRTAATEFRAVADEARLSKEFGMAPITAKMPTIDIPKPPSTQMSPMDLKVETPPAMASIPAPSPKLPDNVETLRVPANENTLPVPMPASEPVRKVASGGHIAEIETAPMAQVSPATAQMPPSSAQIAPPAAPPVTPSPTALNRQPAPGASAPAYASSPAPAPASPSFTPSFRNLDEDTVRAPSPNYAPTRVASAPPTPRPETNVIPFPQSAPRASAAPTSAAAPAPSMRTVTSPQPVRNVADVSDEELKRIRLANERVSYAQTAYDRATANFTNASRDTAAAPKTPSGKNVQGVVSDLKLSEIQRNLAFKELQSAQFELINAREALVVPRNAPAPAAAARATNGASVATNGASGVATVANRAPAASDNTIQVRRAEFTGPTRAESPRAEIAAAKSAAPDTVRPVRETSYSAPASFAGASPGPSAALPALPRTTVVAPQGPVASAALEVNRNLPPASVWDDVDDTVKVAPGKAKAFSPVGKTKYDPEQVLNNLYGADAVADPASFSHLYGRYKDAAGDTFLVVKLDPVPQGAVRNGFTADPHSIMKFLGPETADILGYRQISPDLFLLPTATTLNRGLDTLESRGIQTSFRYFEPTEGTELVTHWDYISAAKGGKLPVGPGHAELSHDANVHGAAFLIPPRVRDDVTRTANLTDEFKAWVKAKHPDQLEKLEGLAKRFSSDIDGLTGNVQNARKGFELGALFAEDGYNISPGLRNVDALTYARRYFSDAKEDQVAKLLERFVESAPPQQRQYWAQKSGVDQEQFLQALDANAARVQKITGEGVAQTPTAVTHVRPIVEVSESALMEERNGLIFADMGDMRTVVATPQPRVIGTTALLSCSGVACFGKAGVGLAHFSPSDIENGIARVALQGATDIGEVKRVEILHGPMAYGPHKAQLEANIREVYGKNVEVKYLELDEKSMTQRFGYEVRLGDDGMSVRPVRIHKGEGPFDGRSPASPETPKAKAVPPPGISSRNKAVSLEGYSDPVPQQPSRKNVRPIERQDQLLESMYNKEDALVKAVSAGASQAKIDELSFKAAFSQGRYYQSTGYKAKPVYIKRTDTSPAHWALEIQTSGDAALNGASRLAKRSESGAKIIYTPLIDSEAAHSAELNAVLLRGLRDAPMNRISTDIEALHELRHQMHFHRLRKGIPGDYYGAFVADAGHALTEANAYKNYFSLEELSTYERSAKQHASFRRDAKRISESGKDIPESLKQIHDEKEAESVALSRYRELSARSLEHLTNLKRDLRSHPEIGYFEDPLTKKVGAYVPLTDAKGNKIGDAEIYLLGSTKWDDPKNFSLLESYVDRMLAAAKYHDVDAAKLLGDLPTATRAPAAAIPSPSAAANPGTNPVEVPKAPAPNKAVDLSPAEDAKPTGIAARLEAIAGEIRGRIEALFGSGRIPAATAENAAAVEKNPLGAFGVLQTKGAFLTQDARYLPADLCGGTCASVSTVNNMLVMAETVRPGSITNLGNSARQALHKKLMRELLAELEAHHGINGREGAQLSDFEEFYPKVFERAFGFSAGKEVSLKDLGRFGFQSVRPGKDSLVTLSVGTAEGRHAVVVVDAKAPPAPRTRKNPFPEEFTVTISDPHNPGKFKELKVYESDGRLYLEGYGGGKTVNVRVYDQTFPVNAGAIFDSSIVNFKANPAVKEWTRADIDALTGSEQMPKADVYLKDGTVYQNVSLAPSLNSISTVIFHSFIEREKIAIKDIADVRLRPSTP